ncbi:helix-turn-helix transcriptional regulator [Saccharothrix yanglingensis]|uniref:Transcriptional regulator n=1 Tax=Saccharothrix yanglingensis TaxID=659496 RepID=A0ABU0X9X4_9PSEU|nr:helix-turn-helix transcriptional regulator [Saccharothrix yanglingensis]MDQ2588756.1 transcriptional regulator [Saccharothrix yanglingensis]
MDKHGLASFLRRCRERSSPSTVGLPVAGPRRTPGLRREEVAGLAHISTQYYTRLEQARGPRPSRHVLAALGRALRLTDAERAHLHALVGEAVGPPTGPPAEVPDGVLELIERLPDTAAIVLDAKYDVLAWNPLAAALLEDFSALSPRDRNVIRRFFLRPDDPRRHYGLSHGDAFARFAAGHLRAAATRYPHDRATQALVAELLRHSREFAELWPTHDVTDSRHLVKSIDHELVGRVEVTCDVLEVPERDQHLVLFTAAPGTPAREALRLLGVVGTQRMTTEDEPGRVSPP